MTEVGLSEIIQLRPEAWNRGLEGNGPPFKVFNQLAFRLQMHELEERLSIKPRTRIVPHD